MDYTPAPADRAQMVNHVKAAGRRYLGRTKAAHDAHRDLVDDVRAAYRFGLTVTELSEASGLSRFAIARAVRGIEQL
jgi:hypothetical protein